MPSTTPQTRTKQQPQRRTGKGKWLKGECQRWQQRTRPDWIVVGTGEILVSGNASVVNHHHHCHSNNTNDFTRQTLVDSGGWDRHEVLEKSIRTSVVNPIIVRVNCASELSGGLAIGNVLGLFELRWPQSDRERNRNSGRLCREGGGRIVLERGGPLGHERRGWRKRRNRLWNGFRFHNNWFRWRKRVRGLVVDLFGLFNSRYTVRVSEVVEVRSKRRRSRRFLESRWLLILHLFRLLSGRSSVVEIRILIIVCVIQSRSGGSHSVHGGCIEGQAWRHNDCCRQHGYCCYRFICHLEELKFQS